MDDVKKLVEQLDDLVPKQGAEVALTQYGAADESQVVANERGYLRLGIEFMKLAYAEKRDKDSPDLVSLDVEYLVVPGSSVWFQWCERKDHVQLQLPVGHWTDRLLPLGCFAVLFSILGLATYGLFALIAKLFS